MSAAENRLVAHADMDAFYAAIEQLDDPALRGRPVLVGPKSERGVVLTASYEARPYGVGSAMPMSRARRRCPDAVIVPPRFERYTDVSKRVMRVFADFSPRVEPLSLDEAFLDMSGAERVLGSPEEIGRRLKQAVRDATGLAVSVGLAATKYVAKVASEFGKPDGLTVVPAAEARDWLAPLPVKRLWGAGPKVQQRLVEAGFTTIGDVARADARALEGLLGRLGSRLHGLANAEDPRAVEASRAAKSIGAERTLERDIREPRAIRFYLRKTADVVGRRLRKAGLVAGGVRVKLKRSDFRLLSRQTTLGAPTDSTERLFETAAALLPAFGDAGPYRLVGLAAFELAPAADSAQIGLGLGGQGASRDLDGVLDRIAARFGPGAVVRASELYGDLTLGTAVNLDFLHDDDADERE